MWKNNFKRTLDSFLLDLLFILKVTSVLINYEIHVIYITYITFKHAQIVKYFLEEISLFSSHKLLSTMLEE